MGWILLFAGQGGQHPGMLPWLDEDAPLLREAACRLGVAAWREVLEDPARRARNREAQVLLTAAMASAWRMLAPALPAPCAVAGYSVGELSAWAAAGALDEADLLALAEARAAAMDAAAAACPGGLLALEGGAPDARLAWAQAQGLSLAIDRGPAMHAVGGPEAALARAAAGAAAAGFGATRLAVGLASHTPALAGAAAAFAGRLAQAPVQAPRLRLIGHAEAAPVRHAADARRQLAAQIAAPVRWREVGEQLAALGPKAVLELGGGDALSRDWRARHPEVPARCGDDFRSAAALRAWLARSLDAG